jgi:hypothetical protein
MLRMDQTMLRHTIFGTALLIAATPALCSPSGPRAPQTARADISNWSLASIDATEADKVSARYALGDTEDGFASDATSGDVRIKWKFNKIKMRVSLDTSDVQ